MVTKVVMLTKEVVTKVIMLTKKVIECMLWCKNDIK